jgi:hypothetical protein
MIDAMQLTPATTSTVIALAASVILVVREDHKLFPTMAVLASGVEAVMAFGLMQISMKGFSLGLALAALLTVGGVFSWTRAREKTSVSTSAIVALVGALQLLVAVKMIS